MTSDPRPTGVRRHEGHPLPPPRLRTFPARADAHPTTRQLVEELVAEARAGAGHDVDVEVDVPAALPLPTDRETLRRLLAPLLARSMDGARRDPWRGRRGRGVTITAVRCPHAVEIEVADSGPAAGDHGAGLAEVGRRATALGGALVVADCPDGGTAFTVRLPVGRAALRRAA